MFGKDAIVISLKLFVITAVAALCLAFVNNITTPIIEKNAEKTKTEALKTVLSDADEFAKIDDIEKLSENGADVEEVYQAKKNSEVVGYVVTAVSHEGYGGDVKVMVGVDKELKVTKIEILESSETAGLGANASQPKFAGQFEGQGGGLTVVKGDAADGQISAISSATVTSKAVTNCVNLAVKAAENVSAEADTSPAEGADATDSEEKNGGEE